MQTMNYMWSEMEHLITEKDNRMIKKTVKEITAEYLGMLLKRRPADSHKGTYGKVLIIAGSSGMAGAALFSGRACMRAGAGLTRYYVPKELFNILQLGAPEATCIERPFLKSDFNESCSEGEFYKEKTALPDGPDKRESFPGNFSKNSKKIDYDEYDAIAIGPGLGKDFSNALLMSEILRQYKGKLVIDADGLNTIAENDMFDDLLSSDIEKVISPHPGEAARLLGTSIRELPKDRVQLADMLAEKTGAVVILKGHETIVSDGCGNHFINRTGTPAMAKGGSGDVLTGIITAFAAQGMSMTDAACAAVYIHGKAGQMAEKETGSYGMLATDMIEKIGLAIEDVIV